MDRYEELGRRLRRAREERGWTQRELAEAAEISQTAVHHYERGERRLHVAELERLAGLLGKSVDFFLSREETAPAPAPSTRERRVAEVLGLSYLPIYPAAELTAASGVRETAQHWLALPEVFGGGADAVIDVPEEAASDGLRGGDLLVVRLDPDAGDAPQLVVTGSRLRLREHGPLEVDETAVAAVLSLLRTY